MPITSDLKLALDRAQFWRACGIGEPLDWQKRALSSEARMQLYNCARQTGKSQVAAVLAVWTVLYKPNTLVLMVSRTLDHSGELFKLAMRAYNNVGREQVSAASETALSLTLSNGSRIVARPAANEGSARGYTADLLIVDEASRVSDDLYAASTPVLARTGGRIVALSTPFGARGWWYEAWRAHEEPWDRYRVTADDLPEEWYQPNKTEYLAGEKRRVGQWWHRQEFYAEFLDPVDQFFSTELIESMISSEVEPLRL